MRVILLEKVLNRGNFGDVVRVRPGYARNFLLPSGKALLATASNLKYFEERRLHLQEMSQQEEQRAQARAERFSQAKLVVQVQADSDGKLFGSVNVSQIIEAAKSQNLELKRSEIHMPPEKRIRKVGEHDIALHFNHNVSTSVSLQVIAAK